MKHARAERAFAATLGVAIGLVAAAVNPGVAAANDPPVAAFTADHTSGNLPLTVAFDASGSSDPDGDTLGYMWELGDGAQVFDDPTPSHTYTQAGTYYVTLIVEDAAGASDEATVPIHAGNNPPILSIDSPLPGERFGVGEQIVLTGSALDPEEGGLPLTWEVARIRSDGVEVFMGPTTGNDIPLIAPEPESLEATLTTRLEIKLTASDSRGLTSTVTQSLEPHTVALTFASAPANLTLDVAGTTVDAPLTITSWRDWQLDIAAYDQAAGNDDVWAFDGWSDGGPAQHTIVTPDLATTYTASFSRVSAPPRPPPLQPLVPSAPAPKALAPRSSSSFRLGTNGRDRIIGTNARDRVCGRGGGDYISLGGGADVAYGGECWSIAGGARVASLPDGPDVMRGGAGADRMYGNAGNDVIRGDRGADSLSGGGGADRLVGGEGADRLRGGTGNDDIHARDGRREVVDCGPGRDRVRADRVDVLRRCEVEKS